MTNLDTTLHYLEVLQSNSVVYQPEIRQAIARAIKICKVFQDSQALKQLMAEVEQE